MNNKRIKVFEAFGGMGAPRKAFGNLLSKHLLKFMEYVEFDQLPVDIYNRLYDHQKQTESMVGYQFRPDVFIHGSPCQDFSVAGKRIGGFQGSNTRSSLMWETVRTIGEFGVWKPKVVVWENVKGVLSQVRLCKECNTHANYKESGTTPCKCGITDKTNYDNFQLYLKSLEELGYVNHYEVLNGIHFGIPQARERIFVVSILKDATEYLHFNFKNVERQPMKPLQDFLEQDVDRKYYLEWRNFQSGMNAGRIKRVENNIVMSDDSPWVLNNKGTLRVPIYNFNAENYIQMSLGKDMYIRTITAEGAQSRLKIFVPKRFDDVPTLKLNDGKEYHVRVLTPLEAWQLMGFTKKDHDKVKDFTDLQLYYVAGNSIIVQVLEAIFKELLGE